MSASTLDILLDANARFSLDAKGTTNHCPMALVALAKMGAPPSRLQAFFDYWEREYALLLPQHAEPVARAAWPAQQGRREAFDAVKLCFEGWLAEADAAQVLAAVLQQIPAAPGSGAFHAWIRLSYGLEAAHAGEIAAGLAALVVGNLAIPVALIEPVAASSVDAALARLAQVFCGTAFAGNSITGRLRAVAADSRFAAALTAPPAMPGLSATLDAMAHTAIAAYWQTADFTVLHMVTVIHAARRIFAMLPAQQAPQLLRELWVAWCAAYVSIGAPPLDPAGFPVPGAETLPDWAVLLTAAVASNNDHVIKLSYTCYCEAARDPQPLYRAVVARLLQGDAVAV